MKQWLLPAAVLVSACEPPCRTQPEDTSIVCARTDAGAALYPRVYSALEQRWAERCAGALVDGGLVLTVEITTCSSAADREPEYATTCELPALPPGHYPLRGAALIVPADGGAFECGE